MHKPGMCTLVKPSVGSGRLAGHSLLKSFPSSRGVWIDFSLRKHIIPINYNRRHNASRGLAAWVWICPAPATDLATLPTPPRLRVVGSEVIVTVLSPQGGCQTKWMSKGKAGH